MTNSLSPANLVARSTAFARALAQHIPLSTPRLLPFRQRASGAMSAARPAQLTLLAALTVLALAGVLFTLYVHPAYAQDGLSPDKPTGLYATATHDQVILTWDDPGDDSITGYVILRRVRVNNTGGEFSELVADTGTAATTYTDSTVAASTTYTYRIKAINEHGVSERSRWFHIDIPAAPERPDKPTGLFATATHDSVMLTWNDPQDDSITGYVILRRNRDTDAKGHFDELVADTGKTATTYTDGSVAAETRYTYRIKAINQYSASERSRWYHIDTSAAPEPETDPADLAPSGLTALLTDGQVVLAWDAPAEDAGSVTGYEVLRGQEAADLTTLVADTGNTATTYTDAPAAGAGYAYRVKAIRDGERSGVSNEARVQLRPAIPTGLSTEAVAHDTVTLTWDDPQDDSVTGYAVVRWGLGYNSSGTVTIAPDTGYTDETVEPETEYIYNIKAINAQGESEKSEPLRVKTPEAPDPALLAPANTTTELVDRQVVLGWDAPVLDAASVTGYEVLRARGEDDQVILVADTGNTATTHTDETADAPGESYTYRVKAVRDGERSQASDAAVIQLPDPPPSAPSGLAAYYGSGGVSLVWNAPTEDVGTVTGYEVLRARGEGELNTLMADTGNAATAYTDFSAGGTSESYAYRVRAIRGEEKSGDSNETRVQLPPAAPKRVVSAASSDLVLLSWADPQDDSVTGYRILRRLWAGDEPGEFSTLAEDTGSAETAYADDTVETGRVYVYRVLAINPGGVSEPSSDVRVRTAAPVAPQEPVRAERANVSEGTTDLPFDDTTTGEVDVGGTVTGSNADRFDKDWFAVELEAGTRYQIDLEGSPTGRGTQSDPLVTLHAPTAADNPGSDDDGGVGLNARTVFTPKEDGTHYISARSNSLDNTDATYTLSVIVLGANGASEADTDFPRTTATTGRVEVGASATGNIGSEDDLDGFRVDLEAGGRYQFDLEGADTGRGTLSDPFLSLYGDDFKISHYIGEDDDGGEGLNSRLTYTATATGTYHLEVGENVGATGTYTLSVRELRTPVDVGGSVTGNIEADDDRNRFKVDLEANTAYEIAVKGFFTDFVPGIFNHPSRTPNYGYNSARYSLHAPAVTVRDSEGETLLVGRSSTVISSTAPCRPLYFEHWDPVVEFTPDEAGTYTIEVASLGDGNYWKRSAPDSDGECTSLSIQYDATGTYEVSVREWPPHISKPVKQSSAPSYWYWKPGKSGFASKKPRPAHEAFTGVAEGETHPPNTYGRRETIELTVTFTEAVQVTGTPELHLRGSTSPGLTVRSSGDRWARYDRGTGTQQLVFAYTVQSGDYYELGFSTGAWLQGGKKLVFRLSGDAAITSVATGSHAVLDSYQGVASNAHHRVNGRVVTPEP